MQNQFTVYILSNASRHTYIGLTSNLEARLYQHRQKVNPGFTRDHNINLLVYYELYEMSDDAIARERQIESVVAGEEASLDRNHESQLDRPQRRVGLIVISTGVEKSLVVRQPSVRILDGYAVR